MVLHSLDVVVDHVFIELEESQKIGQELMPAGNIAGKAFAGFGQDEAAILFVFEESFAVEALDHVGHAGLRNLETFGNVDDPGISLGIDQVEDPLQIILDRRGVAPGLFRGGHGGDIKANRIEVKIKIFGN